MMKTLMMRKNDGGDDEGDLDSDRSYGQADKRPHNPAPVLLHHLPLPSHIFLHFHSTNFDEQLVDGGRDFGMEEANKVCKYDPPT